MNQPNVAAIILAGGLDFGASKLVSHLPRSLWPVAGRPALERLIVCLADQGIGRATVCTRGDGSSLAEGIQVDARIQLEFLDESLPVGTAGCIRDAAGDTTNGLLLVLSAGIISPPKIDVLINAHRDAGADFSAMFNPKVGDNKSVGEPADIYVCDTGIIGDIPKDGYFDIKEGLIPRMVQVGKAVHNVTLAKPVGNFRDRQSYLSAIANYLQNGLDMKPNLKLSRHSSTRYKWMPDTVGIDSSARLCGPVVVMEGARIAEDAVVIGPTIIGRNSAIGKGSVVANTVLWDDAQIGPNCQVQQCIVDYHAVVPGNTIVEEKSIPFQAKRSLSILDSKAITAARLSKGRLQENAERKSSSIADLTWSTWIRSRNTRIIAWTGGVAVLGAFLWSYWPVLRELWKMWQRSDEYSSGLLVPFLAVYILWSRRNDLAQCQIRPCLWGMCAFVAVQVIRLFGLAFVFSSAENLSVALSIGAIVLLLFGWRLFRKVSTVLLFLCLMLPWPTRMQAAVSLPLQRWATSSAVFCLETIGYEVRQEGNLIHIGDASVAVAEACNGLRMVTAFFVITGLVVLLVRRAWWEKLIVLSFSLPVALLCNTTRLAITAIAFTVVSGEYWEKLFHDFGGYAMMPLALAIVVAELWILAKLTTPPTEEETIVITRQTQ